MNKYGHEPLLVGSANFRQMVRILRQERGISEDEALALLDGIIDVYPPIPSPAPVVEGIIT